MKGRGIISYPDYINYVSIYIGRIRDMLNARMNDQAPAFKRGEKSGSVNILGVFGELVFAHHLHNQQTEYEQAPIISNSAVVGPDFIIGDYRIDVKTIGEQAPDILVNVDAHLKKKDITHYVFIQAIGDNKARYWTFSYDTVSKWPVKDVRYSNAYFKKII